MPNKDTTPLSLYGNDREYLREQEKTNELLADIAGEEYESPGNIPNGKYILQKRMLDAAQKKNELLESIAGGGGGGGGAAKGIDIDYGTDVISLTNKDGDPIQGSGATLPAYGVSFDPTTGGLTLTKNGTAVQGQTVTIPNYGSPVGVTSSSAMTDEGTIYLYEGTTGGGYAQGHFYYWDGTAWADGGEYAAATVQTDKTLLVENRAADAKATGEAVGELKTQKVNKAGTGEVTSKNIEGMTAIGTPTPEWSDNIFSEAELVATGKYVAGIGGVSGKGYLAVSAGLDTYIIAVEQNTLYSFTNCRTALVVADLEYTPVGDFMAGPDITKINSSTGVYILFSFNPTKYPANDYVVKKRILKYQYQIPDDWYIPQIGNMDELDYDNLVDAINDINPKENRPVYNETEGVTFTANTYISLPVYSCTRKNTRLIFRANISSLGNFEIGFTTKADASGTKYNRFVIRQNSLTAYLSYNYQQQTMNSEAITHNLNITTGSLQVIIEEHPNATCTITVENNGNTFKHTFEGYVKNNTLQPYCYSAYGSFSKYKFVWSCTDLDKKIWMFGDSYMAYSQARWPYYLEEYGYARNALINSFPGCWSSTAITALNSLINYGNPKYIIWAMGMNDGSDSESAPSTSWANNRDLFISVCEENNIEPVFCTIPTVPTVNNEQKNAWIRASGYRYIDFARAVNASASGVWNTGTLSSDGVHPTVNGARALYAEFVLDFPEIMQGLDGVYPPIIPEKIGDNTEKKLVFNADTDNTVTWTNW